MRITASGGVVPIPPFEPCSQSLPTSQSVTGLHDVDLHTGFLPPQGPVTRLIGEYSVWEDRLRAAAASKLKVGDADGITAEDLDRSEKWRKSIRSMPTRSTSALQGDTRHLRRAHQVLASLLHFYANSHPPPEPHDPSPIQIPASIAVPLCAVSHELGTNPILTHADLVLWNRVGPDGDAPLTLDNLRVNNTVFTGTVSEEHFFRVTAQIELRGAEALDILLSISPNSPLLEEISAISGQLEKLAKVIDAITDLLLAMRDHCIPSVFYNEVRPWIRGMGGRPWIFEGVAAADAPDADSLSGPSAAQSTLLQALDIFLGVEHASDFLRRMENFMPGPHRAFLHHLRASGHCVRPMAVAALPSSPLRISYDRAVASLKTFRDVHIRIVTLYIISPSRAVGPLTASSKKKDVEGTGGTDVIPFLKVTRDETKLALLPSVGIPHAGLNVVQ